MTDGGLVLSDLSKRFNDHLAVDRVSLAVTPGKVLALLGPSGSGKTTTLRLIAGFERPDSGRIAVNGRDVTDLTPAQRRFGMVFQNYALFPHLTVAENVGFGLDRRSERSDRDDRVAEALGMVDLSGFERRNVTDLSGGQQQRVAVARAIAPRPDVLLFDEPLSNLDPSLRERTRRELREALDHVGVTTVFVTHEQDEAFALGDMVAVLHEGRVQQVASPLALYEEPVSPFVATFVGRASTVQGIRRDGGIEVKPGIVWEGSVAEALEDGARALATIRPEAFEIIEGAGVAGTVVERRYTGARAFFGLDSEIGPLEVEASPHTAAIGDTISVRARETRIFRSNG